MFDLINRFKETRKAEAGFTIGEVMVVTVIMGTLASIAMPAVIGNFDEDKNFEVQTNAIQATNAISEYMGTNGGQMPASLDDTNYKNWSDNTKINVTIKGYDVCLIGWNSSGGDYTVDTPYLLFNGVPVDECDFSTTTYKSLPAPSVINPATPTANNITHIAPPAIEVAKEVTSTVTTESIVANETKKKVGKNK